MSRLSEIIIAMDKQNDIVGVARNTYLTKEAERKHFEATLIQAASGKSHAEKVVNAQATSEWLEFHKELARAESVYEFQKFKLEIIEKEWLAAYAELKNDERLIKKVGVQL